MNLRTCVLQVQRVLRLQRAQALHQQFSTAHSSPASLKVWWDAECPLCTKEIRLMKRLDTESRIEFVPITKTSSSSELSASMRPACPVDKKTLLGRFHAKEKNQEIVDGAAAFVAMWRQIPALHWLGNAAKNATVLWMLERFYRGFLVIRPSLQRWAKKAEK